MHWLVESALSNAVVTVLVATALFLISRLTRKPALIHCLWLLLLIKLLTPALIPISVPATWMGWWSQPSAPEGPPFPTESDRFASEFPAARIGDHPSEDARSAAAIPLQASVDRHASSQPPRPDLTSHTASDAFAAPPFAGQTDRGTIEIGTARDPALGERAVPLDEGRVAYVVPENDLNWNPQPIAADADGRWDWSVCVPVLLVTWALGSLIWISTAIVRGYRFQRMLRFATPAPASLRGEAASLARRLGLARCPDVWVVPGGISPMLWWFGGPPRLLFPKVLLSRLDSQARQTLMLHELAHLYRRDHWARALELLVTGLYWWHPIVWWARREIHIAEEECCDALVVEHTPGGARTYATALLETIDFLAETRPVLPPAASGIGHAEFLRRRLMRIMEERTSGRLSRLSRWLVAAWATIWLPFLPMLGRSAAESVESREATPANSVVLPTTGVDFDSVTPGTTPAPLPGTAIASAERLPKFENNPTNLQFEPARLWCAAYSPDGRQVATVSGWERAGEMGELVLWDLETQQRRILYRDLRGIRSLAFSPDGCRLAIGSFDGRARIVDAVSGQVLSVREAHKVSITSLAFTSDGRKLVTGSVDGQAKLWDLTTGRLIAAFGDSPGTVSDLAISADDRLLLVGHHDHTARLWELDTGRLRLTFRGHSGAVESVGFSPDGMRAATASEDRTIRLWDVATGKVQAVLSGHADRVLCVAWSPDGRRLASCSADKAIKLWDVADGRDVLTIPEAHAAMPRSVQFSTSGDRLLTSSWDTTAKVWELLSGRELAVLKRQPAAKDPPHPVLSLACAPDGTMLATAHGDRTVRLRDALTGEVLRSLAGHADVVSQVAYSLDGRTLATASYDRTVKLWNAETGQERLTLNGHTNWVFCVAFSPDGRQLATGGYDKTIRLWDTATGQQIAQWADCPAAVRAIAFSRDGERLASGHGDHTAAVWDVAERKPLAWLTGHLGAVRAMAFSSGGTLLATASADGTIQVWDIATGRERATLRGHHGSIQCLAFSPGGHLLASGGFDRTIKLWDVASGREHASLAGHRDFVTTLAFSPNAQTLLSGSDDATIRRWQAQPSPIPPLLTREVSDSELFFAVLSPQADILAVGGNSANATLWNMRTGEVLHVLRGHAAGVASAAFSPDGKRLVTGSLDRTLRLWDVESGRPVAVFRGHRDPVRQVAFAPDGRLVASSSWEGTARIWDIESGRTVITLPQQPLPLTSIQFSPDGRWLATTSGGWKPRKTPGELTLWDAETGREFARLVGHQAAIHGAVFSPDGTLLASYDADGKVRVWDVEKRSPQSVLIHETAVVSAEILPGNRWLASVDLRGRLRLWEIATQQPVTDFEGQRQVARSLDVSADGSLLVTAGRGGVVQFWPTEPMHPVSRYSVPTDSAAGLPHSLAMAPDGELMAIGTRSGHLMLLDRRSGTVQSTWKAHPGRVNDVAFSPDGRLLVTAGFDQTARLWNVSTHETVRTWHLPSRRICRVRFSPDGRRILTAGDGGEIVIWDAASGQRLRMVDGKQPIEALAMSPEGTHLATGHPGGRIVVRHLEGGESVMVFALHAQANRSRIPSTEERLVATDSPTLNASRPQSLWDRPLEPPRVWRERDAARAADTIRFAPDGRTMLTTAADGTVRLWDFASGRTLQKLPISNSQALAFTFSPDGRTLAIMNRQTAEIELRNLPEPRRNQAVGWVCDWTDAPRIAADSRSSQPERRSAGEPNTTLPDSTTPDSTTAIKQAARLMKSSADTAANTAADTAESIKRDEADLAHEDVLKAEAEPQSEAGDPIDEFTK